MDTHNNNLFERLLYSPLTNFIPFKPLIIWANANHQLNAKYLEPGIDITNNSEDEQIRNTARHITGLGLAASQYGVFAYPIGYIKEAFDLTKDFFSEPTMHFSTRTIEDSKIDLKHNNIGIQYILNNPDATCDELMEFAISYAREEQAQQDAMYNNIG